MSRSDADSAPAPKDLAKDSESGSESTSVVASHKGPSHALATWMDLLHSPAAGRRFSAETYRWVRAFLLEELVREGREKGYDGVQVFTELSAKLSSQTKLERGGLGEPLEQTFTSLQLGASRWEWGTSIKKLSDIQDQLLVGSASAVSLRGSLSSSLLEQSVFQSLRAAHQERYKKTLDAFGAEMQVTTSQLAEGVLKLLSPEDREQWSRVLEKGVSESEGHQKAKEQVRRTQEALKIADGNAASDQDLQILSAKLNEAKVAQELYRQLRENPEKSLDSGPFDRNEVEREIRDCAKKLHTLSLVLLTAEKKHWERAQKSLPEQRAIRERLGKMLEQAEKDPLPSGSGIPSAREFGHDLLSGKKSTSELLSEVWSQLSRSDLNAGERKALEDRKSILTATQKLSRNMGEILDGAQTLIQIGSTLGVDPQFLGKVSKGVQVGMAAQKVLEGFMSGGLSGVTSALSVIAGFGAPDLGLERHREVMAQFGVLAQGQEAILKFSEAILKGQEILFEQQKAILSAVNSLSEQVSKMHEDLSSQIEEVREEVLHNRGLVLKGLGQDFEACFAFSQEHGMWSWRKTFDESRGGPQAYAPFSTYLQSHQGDLVNCRTGMQQVLTNYQGVSPVLLLESYRSAVDPEKDRKIQVLVKNLFGPVVQYYFEKSQGKDPKIAALNFPMKRADQMDEVLGRVVQSGARFDTLGTDSENHSLRLKELISIDALSRVSSVTVEMIPWLESVASHDLSVESLEKLMVSVDREALRPLPYEYVRQALSLVQVAIAQQSLLAGVGIIPEMYGDLMSKNAEKEKRVIGILENNPTLASNFVLYAVIRNLKEQKLPQEMVEFVRHDRSAYSLEKSLTLPLKKVFSDSGIWNYDFGKFRVQIPAFVVLREARLSYPSEMQSLLDLRAFLAGYVADWEFRQIHSPNFTNGDWMGLYHRL